MWHLITYFSEVHRDETYCISLVKKICYLREESYPVTLPQSAFGKRTLQSGPSFIYLSAFVLKDCILLRLY